MITKLWRRLTAGFRTIWGEFTPRQRLYWISGLALSLIAMLGSINLPAREHEPVRPPIRPAAAAPTTTVLPRVEVVRVTEVTDGDTFHTDHGDTVRVLAIDTDETKDPRRPVGCYGPAASQWASMRLSGQTVALVPDPTQDDRDSYGRLLRYVQFGDGSDYGLDAVAEGVARAYAYRAAQPPVRYPDYHATQLSAQAAGSGMWGSCYPYGATASPSPAPVPVVVADSGDDEHHVATPRGRQRAGDGASDSGGGSAYYPSCKAARAAGAAPLHRGDPGYSGKLDRDGDGVACEN